jgi:hypothetical protein
VPGRWNFIGVRDHYVGRYYGDRNDHRVYYRDQDRRGDWNRDHHDRDDHHGDRDHDHFRR